MVFVVLIKDNAPLNGLFKALEESPIITELIKVMKELYNNAYFEAKIGNTITKAFSVMKELREGAACIFATKTFLHFL